ncbi:MAG TPA: TIGR03435 family protein, partial [Candidatus Polarisedimenticolia bacterium]|nr:TIGR03435 family protein [Candidatus Polarisedimenticolia bacterium]
YAITVAKGGEKIKKEENAPVPIPGFGGPPPRGFNVRNATIAEFASVMQAQFMEQPVVDQTGLGDTRYSFILKWTPDPSQTPGFGGGPPAADAPAPDADAPPDLFTAMQQQLGLQMRITKAPVEVMVIDKVQKPSDN